MWFSIQIQITCFIGRAVDERGPHGVALDDDAIEPDERARTVDEAALDRAVGVSLLQLDATTIAIDMNTDQPRPE